jgi:hypothetical protein
VGRKEIGQVKLLVVVKVEGVNLKLLESKVGNTTAVVVIVALVILGLSYSLGSEASDLMLELGVSQNFYEEDSKINSVSDSLPDIGFVAKAGWGDFPVYGVVSYESMKLVMRGQNIASPDILTIGVGASHEVGKASVFLEAGYADVTTNSNTRGYDTVNEVAYTELVDRHHVPGREIPVDNRQGYYNSSYELDNGPFVSIGVGYQLWSHTKVSFAYRVLHVDEEIAIWDTDRRNNNEGYWREDGTKNLNAFSLSVLYTY